MKIGVLSLQGDYESHITILKSLNIECLKVKYKKQFKDIDALIMPGGESTAISNLINKEKLYKTIMKFLETKPVYGACAGLILLSNDINDDINKKKVRLFKILDIKVNRNGWGRQIDSFADDITIKSFKDKYNAIFIRAPKIIYCNKSIEVLSKYSNTPVMIRKDHILGTTFHPELTNDIRIHQYFVDMVKEYN